MPTDRLYGVRAMVDGGQFSDLLFDLAAVYELAGHTMTTVQQLTAFLFHQAESLRLTAAGGGPAADPQAVFVAVQAYTQGTKTYVRNVVEGINNKRRRYGS